MVSSYEIQGYKLAGSYVYAQSRILHLEMRIITYFFSKIAMPFVVSGIITWAQKTMKPLLWHYFCTL